MTRNRFPDQAPPSLTFGYAPEALIPGAARTQPKTSPVSAVRTVYRPTDPSGEVVSVIDR